MEDSICIDKQLARQLSQSLYLKYGTTCGKSVLQAVLEQQQDAQRPMTEQTEHHWQ